MKDILRIVSEDPYSNIVYNILIITNFCNNRFPADCLIFKDVTAILLRGTLKMTE